MQYDINLLRNLRFTIGQKIRNHRTKQKLTIRKLARRAEIAELLLDQYEIGKNQISFSHLFKIACVLDVEVKELI